MIRVFDAFSGIGGFRSVFERVYGLKIKVAGFFEIYNLISIENSGGMWYNIENKLFDKLESVELEVMKYNTPVEIVFRRNNMDYTEIFSKAIELKSHYSFDEIKKHIDAHNDFHCGDYDDWADNHWYLLTPTWVISYDKCYGYLCAEYPIALLSDNCPEKLKRLLNENGVLCTKLDEPMSCDEVILQQYVHNKKVFDENFVEKCEYSFDDERFLKLLYKLETGHKQYVDSGSFTMKEIR